MTPWAYSTCRYCRSNREAAPPFTVKLVRTLGFSDVRCLLSIAYVERPNELPELDADVDGASMFAFDDGIASDAAHELARQRHDSAVRAVAPEPVLDEVGADVSCRAVGSVIRCDRWSVH